MKKTWIRLLAIVTGVVCTLTAFGGCNKKGQVDDSDKTLEVYFYNAGYGKKWFDEMETIFEERTDYEIEVKETTAGAEIESMIKAGGDNTTADLFIVGEPWSRYVALGAKAVSGYDVCLEPIDDVYKSELEGEGLTIEEKILDVHKKYNSYEVLENGEYVEHYYSMPWATGYNGLFYNKTIFERAGLTHAPRTTDELIANCETLQNEIDDKDFYPIMQSAMDEYIEYTVYVWWSQYSTLKGWENFYSAKVNDTAIPDPVSSMGIYDDKGMYASLKVMEELYAPANGYVDKLSESYDYTTAQAKFLKGLGAIMPNGCWLENEMKTASSSADFTGIVPMKTPIVSAISDKLSYWGESDSYYKANLNSTKRAEYDAKLMALVDYVDGVTTTLPSGTTQADADIVAAARKVANVMQTLTMAIPAYATAKDAAKEFMKFFATNEAIEIYVENTNASASPFKFDYESWDGYANASEFAKVRFELLNNSTAFTHAHKFPAAYAGGLPSKVKKYSLAFGSQDASTRLTADEWVQQLKNIAEPKMESILTLAGLN